MDGAEKLGATAMICLTIVAAGLLGMWAYSANNNYLYSVQCLNHGKSIQYRTIAGQDTAVKECRK